eukprot:CAMPEP_0204594752 /NCGR_PEP_ID=MMETSP0661-20131031/52266_1 /ASSEMBLY_ACC=CAM_ASM_000606 /TAXON_ID=109239 /ORGANISM="Alexandrium margalefi, Strain AMGDE01CS-322" /LENGTH=31 /DNA_ID= /DNA_START= /DNA_END= /DNA_ORIENTATION=
MVHLHAVVCMENLDSPHSAQGHDGRRSGPPR